MRGADFRYDYMMTVLSCGRVPSAWFESGFGQFESGLGPVLCEEFVVFCYICAYILGWI